MRKLVVLGLLVVFACTSDRAAPTAPPRKPVVGASPTPGDRLAAQQSRLAFILLKEPTLPDAAAVERAYAAFAPDGPALARDPNERSGSVAFTQGDTWVDAALIEAPIPDREADDAARFSLKGLSESWTPQPHRAHLVIAGISKATPPAAPLDRLRDFHRVVAAITDALGPAAVGVYIGNGQVTQDPAFYVEVVRDSPDAILAWMGVSLIREGDGISLLSLGMSQLGLPDVLMTSKATSPGDSVAFLFDLLLYIAKRGERLGAGETVGHDDSQRLPVRYVPSPIDGSVEVLKVELP